MSVYPAKYFWMLSRQHRFIQLKQMRTISKPAQASDRNVYAYMRASSCFVLHRTQQ